MIKKTVGHEPLQTHCYNKLKFRLRPKTCRLEDEPTCRCKVRRVQIQRINVIKQASTRGSTGWSITAKSAASRASYAASISTCVSAVPPRFVWHFQTASILPALKSAGSKSMSTISTSRADNAAVSNALGTTATKPFNAQRRSA